MACPTCDHTMQGIGDAAFWCPRCGTIKLRNSGRDSSEAPMLVERVRKLKTTMVEQMNGSVLQELVVSGIIESTERHYE